MLRLSALQFGLMAEERIDDGTFGDVPAFALGRNIGQRAFELFQVRDFLPDARQMVARHIQDLAAAIVVGIDEAEQAF